MAIDPSFSEYNRAATERIRRMNAWSEAELSRRVGEHWTAAMTLAPLAFWDRRVLFVLDGTERNGELYLPQIDTTVNDLALPLWAAIPPREAQRLAL
ncbi:MAG: hypothetical protein FDZ75_07565, partial [Actinobacteria bacterium]